MAAKTAAVIAGPAEPMSSKGPISSFSCVFCNKTFEDRTLLQEHFRTHGEQKKTVESTETVEKKDGKTPVKCEFCDEVLESVSLAIYHQFKKHKNLAVKYFCPWCGTQFPISHTYLEHLPSHEKQELQGKKEHFECSECNFTFYNMKAFQYHNNSVHSVHKLYQKSNLVPPPCKKIYANHMGDMQSIYYCQYCGKEYIVKFNLQAHIEKIHKKEITQAPPLDIIRCKLCDAYFYSEKAYENHNIYHSPSDVYVASEDMRANIVTKVDQEYDVRRVRPSLQKKMRCYSKPRAVQKNLINDMSDFSPPPSDSSDSDAELPDKKAKEDDEENEDKLENNAITLGQFIEMNSEVFTKNDDLKIEPKTPPEENVPAVQKEKCATVPKTESESGLKNNKKLEVRYITKEELDKMKSKGLLRLAAKPKDLTNIKKIQIVEKPSTSTTAENDVLKNDARKGEDALKTFLNRKRKI